MKTIHACPRLVSTWSSGDHGLQMRFNRIWNRAAMLRRKVASDMVQCNGKAVPVIVVKGRITIW